MPDLKTTLFKLLTAISLLCLSLPVTAAGQVINAECVVSGLKALPVDPLATFLAPRASAMAPASGITTAVK